MIRPLPPLMIDTTGLNAQIAVLQVFNTVLLILAAIAALGWAVTVGFLVFGAPARRRSDAIGGALDVA